VGAGLYRYATGDIFEGDWQNSIKNGKGKMMFANGDIY
jgi:hypothetical protein